MKSFLTLVCLISSLLAALPPSIAASSNPKPDTNNTVTQDSTIPPIPKLQKTIDLSDVIKRNGAVMKMTFSPDSRYLAIVAAPEPGKTDIVVWDLKLDRQQALIHCPPDHHNISVQDILWLQDGKVITFGAKWEWNPMTGEPLPDNPVIGREARLNKDGSKMLTISGPMVGPSYLNIYDTKDWSLQKLYVDGLAVETAAWTAEDKILVGAAVTKETFKKTIDGHFITHGQDVALRLLDPIGKTPTKAVWFPAVPDDRPRYAPWKPSTSVDLTVSSFSRNLIALGANRIVDGNTLKITSYYSLEELENDNSAGGGGKVFSKDGKYLYIKDAKWFDNRKPVTNAIIDTAAGKPIAQFSGGDRGIAISPNGQQLAIGNDRSVQILNLQ